MSTESDLRPAFVEAFPLYVATVLHGRGIAVDEVIGDAVVEGAAVLDGLLRSLEETPTGEQKTSPLELFGEALRPIDRALGTLGVDPGSIHADVRLHPWDVYGLVPGSSAVLGERAHTAHLAWGVTKAHAFGAISAANRRPGVVVLCHPSNVDDLAAAVDTCGYRWADHPGDDAVLALISDDATGADEAIAEALGAGLRVIVFGDIDDLRSVALRAMGVWKVATTDQVLHHLADLLPTIV